MKYWILLTLIGLCCFSAHSQDLLKPKGGKPILVDIIEVTRIEVTYSNRYDSTHTLHTLPKKQVASIRYNPAKLAGKRWSAALTLGGPVLGGKYRLEKLFRKYGFDHPTQSIWGLGHYPRTLVYPAGMFEVTYLQKPNQGIGLSVSASNSGDATGNKNLVGRPIISYREMAIHPFYSIYSRWHLIQLRLGPSIHLNKVFHNYPAADKRYLGQTVTRKGHFRLGVYIGGSVAFFEKEHSYLRFLLEYFYLPQKEVIEPIEGEDLMGNLRVVFPEEKISLGHGIIGIRYGWKW